MSLEHPHLPEPDGEPLEADLLPLLADLDRLAAADRAAPRAGLEDRLMQSTLASLHGVQPTAAQVAELASLDRASAPRTLEASVYEASLPALREQAGAPRLILHSPGTEHDSHRHVRPARTAWWARTPVRLAAAITLIAGAAVAVRLGIPPTTSGPDLDRVKGDMDTLFAAMESRPSSDSSTDTLDPQSDDLTTWLLDGAAS